MFTYKMVREMTLNRVDEDIDDIDTTTENVVNNAINQAYMLVASTVDRRVEDVVLEYKKRIELPRDIITIENIEHSAIGDLSISDYEVRANMLYIRSNDVKSGSFTITYSKYPTPLKDDTDNVELNHGYVYALSAYGAYIYQLYRRKYSSAQLLLQEFNSILGQSTQFLEIARGEEQPV